MKAKTKPSAEALFKAFADRTRLRILNLLKAGELCVCDLVDVLDVPQPKASRHLAYLRRVGLVAARKDGYWSYYRLAAEKQGLNAKLLESLASCEDLMPELAKDRQALKSQASKDRCGTDCC